MKKLIKLFTLIFGFLPIMLYAKEEEVVYKYYLLVEDNVHYEMDVEQNCEYFENVDYDNYIYSSPNYSRTMPESKKGRIINVVDSIKVPTENIYVNSLIFSDFYAKRFNDSSSTSAIKEIDIYDKNGIEVMYTKWDDNGISYYEHLNDGDYQKSAYLKQGSSFRAKFDSFYNVHDLTVRFVFEKDYMEEFKVNIKGEFRNFHNYIEGSVSINNPTDNCTGELCYYDVILSNNVLEDNYDYIDTLYEYKDSMYKCYTKKKVYVPGYFADLEGFIRDEEEARTIEIEEDNDELLLLQSEIDSLNEKINVLDSENILLKENSAYLENALYEESNKTDMFLDFLNAYREENLLYLDNINQNISSIMFLDSPIKETSEVIEEDNSELVALNDVQIKEVKPSKAFIFMFIFGMLSLVGSFIVLIRSRNK